MHGKGLERFRELRQLQKLAEEAQSLKSKRVKAAELCPRAAADRLYRDSKVRWTHLKNLRLSPRNVSNWMDLGPRGTNATAERASICTLPAGGGEYAEVEAGVEAVLEQILRQCCSPLNS